MKISNLLKTSCCIFLSALLLTACSDSSDDSAKEPDPLGNTTGDALSITLPSDISADYETTYTIKVKDETRCTYNEDTANSTITLTPVPGEGDTEDTEYEYKISGYYKGQILVNGDNVKVTLKGAYLENDDVPVITDGSEKHSFDVSFASETVNYIVQNGTSTDKTAAVYSKKKNINIGGSGTGYIIGNINHAVKGDDVEFKGSGTFWLKGTEDGSAINCNTFTVDDERSFTAYLINSKNGIKADENITINSGTFEINGNETGLKTGVKTDSKDETEYFIKLNGGIFTFRNNEVSYETDTDALTIGTEAVIK